MGASLSQFEHSWDLPFHVCFSMNKNQFNESHSFGHTIPKKAENVLIQSFCAYLILKIENNSANDIYWNIFLQVYWIHFIDLCLIHRVEFAFLCLFLGVDYACKHSKELVKKFFIKIVVGEKKANYSRSQVQKCGEQCNIISLFKYIDWNYQFCLKSD